MMTNKPMRLIASFAVYLLGVLAICAALSLIFTINPFTWPILVALLGGYLLGRVTRGIER